MLPIDVLNQSWLYQSRERLNSAWSELLLAVDGTNFSPPDSGDKATWQSHGTSSFLRRWRLMFVCFDHILTKGVILCITMEIYGAWLWCGWEMAPDAGLEQ